MWFKKGSQFIKIKNCFSGTPAEGFVIKITSLFEGFSISQTHPDTYSLTPSKKLGRCELSAVKVIKLNFTAE